VCEPGRRLETKTKKWGRQISYNRIRGVRSGSTRLYVLDVENHIISGQEEAVVVLTDLLESGAESTDWSFSGTPRFLTPK